MPLKTIANSWRSSIRLYCKCYINHVEGEAALIPWHNILKRRLHLTDYSEHYSTVASSIQLQFNGWSTFLTTLRIAAVTATVTLDLVSSKTGEDWEKKTL